MAILWVIDEGKRRVEKGDKLVELDSSELELGISRNRNIKVITAEARVTTADAQVKQAEISRQEYLEGVFKTERERLLGEIAIAEQPRSKAELAIQSSEHGWLPKVWSNLLQLEADRVAVANANNQREAAVGKLRVLEDLTKRENARSSTTAILRRAKALFRRRKAN